MVTPLFMPPDEGPLEDRRDMRNIRNIIIMGMTFKCAVWRWRVDPLRADALGRPLTPEIKITRLDT